MWNRLSYKKKNILLCQNITIDLDMIWTIPNHNEDILLLDITLWKIEYVQQNLLQYTCSNCNIVQQSIFIFK